MTCGAASGPPVFETLEVVSHSLTYCCLILCRCFQYKRARLGLEYPLCARERNKCAVRAAIGQRSREFLGTPRAATPSGKCIAHELSLVTALLLDP